MNIIFLYLLHVDSDKNTSRRYLSSHLKSTTVFELISANRNFHYSSNETENPFVQKLTNPRRTELYIETLGCLVKNSLAQDGHDIAQSRDIIPRETKSNVDLHEKWRSKSVTFFFPLTPLRPLGHFDPIVFFFR